MQSSAPTTIFDERGQKQAKDDPARSDATNTDRHGNAEMFPEVCAKDINGGDVTHACRNTEHNAEC